MSRIDGEGSLYPLLPPSGDNGGQESSTFEPFGRKTTIQINNPKPKSVVTGSDYDRAVSTVTVMPAMRLTWHGICAKPKIVPKPEKPLVSSVKKFFGMSSTEQKKDFIPRGMILDNCKFNVLTLNLF